MNSEGRNNKRKFPFHGRNNNKRFPQNKRRGGPDARDQFRPRWIRPPQSEYSNWNYQNFSFPMPPNNKNYNAHHKSNENQSFCNVSNSLFNELPNDPEEATSVGPGSESDRKEKVLATKRRIEEALATKSSNANTTEITLQDSSSPKEVIKDKEIDKNLPLTNLDNDRIELRLTNSDFKEIGSVANSNIVDGESEGSDLILNIARSSQQRSFDCALPISSTIPRGCETSINKSQGLAGWNMSAHNEIVSGKQVVLNSDYSGYSDCDMPTSDPKDGSKALKSRGEMFIQESREKILGNIEAIPANQVPLPKVVKTKPKQNESCGFEKIGRLYQSFLKSRLCGYTLKMRAKTTPSSGPNPLLDKSVLDNQTLPETQAVTQGNHIIELEMPRPILVKTDTSEIDNGQQTPEDISAVEAQEFCQEFSYLLTHPNFLIPPENLEKLGLGHLSEMNKLIDERRSNNESHEDSTANQDSFLRVRSLNALNSMTENDIVFNQSSMNSSPTLSKVAGLDALLLRSNYNNLNHTIPPKSVISDPNVAVDVVAEKVLEKLSNSGNASSQSVNANILSLLRGIVSQSNQSEHNSPNMSSTPSSQSANKQPSEQMRNISSKILRLFLIDKQIEDLMLEKMKIYNELLSAKEVSSTLFNSWARDQIQHGNVMNVISNTANTVPELGRVLQNQEQTVNGGGFSNSIPCNNINNNSFEEILSAIQNKDQLASSEPTNLPNAQYEPFIPGSLEPPDPIFQVPEDTSSEINKPKLSVRKDLIDPNVNRNLIINDFIPPDEQVPETSSVKSKKKKLKTKVQSGNPPKKNKKQVFEFINLIDDTTDEETSGGGSHSAFDTKDFDRFLKENETNDHPVKKKKVTMVYDLQDSSPTRLTTLNRALIVGCKDGSLKVFSMLNGTEDVYSKLHTDAVMCLHALWKNIITGSADSTISVFSLDNRSKTQSVNVIAPLQCCDVQFCKAYFGTKTGYLVVYKVQTKGDQVSLEQDHQPLKLTNCSILAVRVAEEGSQRVIILASRGEQITVREATTGKVLRTFDWCDTVHCIELYNSSPLVYCGTNTKSVKVMNFTTGENVNDCHLSRAIVQIAFLGSIMFAASFDGQVYVYDVEDKKRICIIQATKGLIQSMIVYKLKIIVACNQNELKTIAFPKELKKYYKKKTNSYCVGSDMTSGCS